MKRLFSVNSIGVSDYVFAPLVFLFIFFFFAHGDVHTTGINSLQFLYGHPLDFYKNAVAARGGNHLTVAYPPAIYLLYAIWLWPAKIVGLIGHANDFPFYLIYWLKVLNTIVYAGAGYVFYRISMYYFGDREFSIFAATLCLTMPFMVFTQFIFTQYDIFYIAASCLAVLLFLEKKLAWGSLAFGVAVTFKFFPIFIFAPLLLLNEKRVLRLALYAGVFVIPSILIQLLYGSSPDFVAATRSPALLGRVYVELFGNSVLSVYGLFWSFSVFCGLCYFARMDQEKLKFQTAYVWLLATVLPIIFVFWHPQWVAMIGPPIVLTTLLLTQKDKLILLDLAGMALFVCLTAVVFTRNVDTAMFRPEIFFEKNFELAFIMRDFFSVFDVHSANVYFSLFVGYLTLQIALKAPLLHATAPSGARDVDWKLTKAYFYGGVACFVVPCLATIYVDSKLTGRQISQSASGKIFGELSSGRTFAQTLVARGEKLERVELLLATFSRRNVGKVVMRILDSKNQPIFERTLDVAGIANNAWAIFQTDNLNVTRGAAYKIQLSSVGAQPGRSITWWASNHDAYKQGNSIVDRKKQPNSDFAFRAYFAP